MPKPGRNVWSYVEGAGMADPAVTAGQDRPEQTGPGREIELPKDASPADLSSIVVRGPGGWGIDVHSRSAAVTRALTWALLVVSGVGAGGAVDLLATSQDVGPTVTVLLALLAGVGTVISGAIFARR